LKVFSNVREEVFQLLDGLRRARSSIESSSTVLAIEPAGGDESRRMSPERRRHTATNGPRNVAWKPSGEAKRILIVEDDLGTSEALSEVLEAEGYEIATAGDGREALERLNGTDVPDLILLDLRMPVMDGWTFRLAQRRNSALAPIPVIAMSADGTSQAATISADAFLKKPLSMPDLLAAIERVLAESERKNQSDRWTLVERMASLGQVAAGVGHEINNPLAFVLINVAEARNELREMAGTTSRANHLVDLLDEALIGLERIRGVVRNVQSLSRKPDQRRAPLRLGKILDESITVARSYLHRARVVKRYEDVPLVMGSPGELGEVFLNLLVSAAQALPGGHKPDNEIAISVAFDGSHVTVEIADNGHGIPPEILPRVFDPFFTTKGHEDGTGLGLSICQQIVTDHGGTLTITSDVGQGTVCRVRLKPTRADGFHVSARPARQEEKTRPSERGRVLVIDDEPLVGGMIRRTLSERHEVVYAENAAAALAVLERDAGFDVVLCDLTMPGMSGPEVSNLLGERWPALASCLVFMTGGAFTERDRAYLRQTTRPVLDKPFTTAELWEVVAEQLDSPRRPQE
jgi:signal transduction histidine kinase